MDHGDVARSSAALSDEQVCGTFVVIPAFNEERAVRDVALRVAALGVHVVVVDDASSDATISRLRGLPISVLHHAVNLGQGATLQTGIDFSLDQGARYLVTFDADGQHDEQDIPRLVHTLVRDDLDIVLGSRFLGTAPGIPWQRKWLLKGAILFTRFTGGIHLTDAHNGLRAFRAEVAERLRITQARMAHASEIVRNIKRAGLRYAEISTIVRYTKESRASGQSSLGALDILFDLTFGRLRR
jgi:glycosyltransferase involved in cell wall biosynthesis